MNDMEFMEALKEKRNACGYSQTRLAKDLHISRQNLNEIENGKTRVSREMKHTLLYYLDYCKCTQPFTLTVDYLRVRFPTTDALEIIQNVLAMKSEYFIHEDYGLFGYEEQYIYEEIIVMPSKDVSIGVLLELRGMGCRQRSIASIKPSYAKEWAVRMKENGFSYKTINNYKRSLKASLYMAIEDTV